MAVLKCKMCGGPIRMIDGRIGECEDCGTRVLMPLINEERILMLYNRGNHFRDVGEYDRAYSAYQSIIAENRDDAEAHWCLLLCRYGINYVKDERTGEFRPTISRMNRSPILEDPDYRAAIRCSEGESREQYIREAKKLFDLQKRFLEIMKKESPYDVFICFKAENEDRTRTEASRIGQDIYEELTARGIRVFFSRITLEDKIGEEFEPYIFSALYTAKVMLVVADKAEQLNARWVKNEWIRFLALMDEDSSRAILPVFYKMDPYDFPPEIPTVQGQDMSALGAMQNLVVNVMELCGKAKEKIRLTTDPGERKLDVDNALRRVEIDLEDHEYYDAMVRLEEILEVDEENGEAWYYMLLALNEAENNRELMTKGCLWTEEKYFKKARQFGDDELQIRLDELEAYCEIEFRYRSAELFMIKKQYQEALEILREIADYSDAVAKIRECESKLELEKKIAAYRKEIGNRAEYAERVRKERYPRESEKLERLREKARRKDSPVDWLDFGYKPLIIMIITWAVYFLVLVNLGEADGEAYSHMYAALVFIFAVDFGISCFIGSLFSSFWTGAICFGVILFGLSKLPDSVTVTIGMVLGVIGSLVCIYATVKSVGFSKGWDAEENYYKNVIKPLETQILNEVDQKWAPIIGRENL